MALQANKVVTFNYTLKDENGEMLDSTDKGGPFSFITGNMQVLPGLEEALGSMIIGSKKNIKLAAVDAYGEYDEGAVQKVKRKPQNVTNHPLRLALYPFISSRYNVSTPL